MEASQENPGLWLQQVGSHVTKFSLVYVSPEFVHWDGSHL